LANSEVDDSVLPESDFVTNTYSGGRRIIVLPKPYDMPPGGFEPFIGLAVALDVLVDLLAPPICIGLGPRTVYGTSVPEASIDKDGDACAWEGHVSPAPCAWKRPVDSKAKSQAVN
jgi:hypothetical protein